MWLKLTSIYNYKIVTKKVIKSFIQPAQEVEFS